MGVALAGNSEGLTAITSDIPPYRASIPTKQFIQKSNSENSNS
jgi:hypothetical protein